MATNNQDLINILWEEWKYRNTIYWQMFYRFGFSILFVSFIPYVYPEIVYRLGNLVVAFPIAGGILSIVAVWLLDAEAARFTYAGKKLSEFRGEYLPDRFPKTGLMWRLRNIKMGYGISILFGVILVVLSALSAYALLNWGVPTINKTHLG